MQKLTYINLLNESVVFQNAAPYVFCEIDGIGPVDVVMKELRGAYQHGATLTGWQREKREVSVTMHIHGATVAAMYRQRQRLSGQLSLERAMEGTARARLLYENDHGRWWTWAVPSGGVSWGKRAGSFTVSTKLRFVCESPWWYAMTADAISFRYGESAFMLPFQFPIRLGQRGFTAEAQNKGQTAVPVEIWVYGAGETPALNNRDTGASLRLTAPLPVGSVLYLNTDPSALAATITDVQGLSSNAFGLVDVAYPLSQFNLRSGANEIVYEPGGDSSQTVIEMRWFSRYEGV